MSEPCEVCRGESIATLTWTYIDSGMVCAKHVAEFTQTEAERRLRATIPKRQWAARELPPQLKALDTSSPTGVFLYGPAGRGKSYAMAALFKRAYVQHTKRRGRPPTLVWRGVLELMDQLRQLQFAKPGTHNLHSELALLYSCDRLVLDDIGAERTTEWTLERILGIVNHRYDAMLPTDFTSNYDLAQLTEQLTPQDEPTGPVGARIVTRIAETCIQVHLNGADRRLQIATERNGAADGQGSTRPEP